MMGQGIFLKFSCLTLFYRVCIITDMRKESVNFTLEGEDAKLIERLKKSLLPTMGKVSSAAVVRIALRKMEKSDD